MKKDLIEVLKFNNYERINPQSLLQMGNKFLTNGTMNEFFVEIENRYLGSPTLQAVVDNYVNYILGDGLIAESGIEQEVLDKIISKGELRKMIHEYKLQGNSPIQIIYNKGDIKKPYKIYSLPARQVAVDRMADLSDEPENYWFSFDWKLRSRFKPRLVPAFGNGDKRETEIYYIKAHSPQPIFSLPDYFSGLQYAKVEEEISNYFINHIMNNFSAGKIININQGESMNEEQEEEVRSTIKNALTGTSTAGNIIVAINRSKENETTIENIEITDAYQQFQFLSEEANKKILLANKVTSPSLFGQDTNTGFSSDSEQMKTALKLLYRNQINPMREVIIDSLEEVLRLGYPEVKIKFNDFEELKTDEENIEENKEI